MDPPEKKKKNKAPPPISRVVFQEEEKSNNNNKGRNNGAPSPYGKTRENPWAEDTNISFFCMVFLMSLSFFLGSTTTILDARKWSNNNYHLLAMISWEESFMLHAESIFMCSHYLHSRIIIIAFFPLSFPGNAPRPSFFPRTVAFLRRGHI